MRKQMGLFPDPPDRPGAYHRDAIDTEVAAAHSIDVNRLERVVLDALIAHPAGLTAQEISVVTGVYLYSAAPRLPALRDKGLVVDSGLRKMGVRGRYCAIWQAAEHKRD